MKRCEGPGCGVEFEVRRSTARYCSDRCRKRASRLRKVPAAPQVEPVVPAAEPPAGDGEHALVASVRAELEQAARLDGWTGQLALRLACRLAAEESGVTALSRELRTVMAAALEGVAPAPSEGPDETEDQTEDQADDEVARARRQREQARQAAGLA